MTNHRHIHSNAHSSAPAKLVLTGEYAVLAGAPALVLAVNARVQVRLAPSTEIDWHCQSLGHQGASRHSLAVLCNGPALAATDPAWLCQHLLQQAPATLTTALPPNLALTLDSSALFAQGQKLGLGSSAALCVALALALASLAGTRADLDWPLAAHSAAQGGQGSGLDVASAWHGGLIRFQRSTKLRISPAQLPAGLQLCWVYAGHPTSTPNQLSRFQAWRSGHSQALPPALELLAHQAGRLADLISDPIQFMAELPAYVRALERMDLAASLGIFGPAHRQLAALAATLGLVYKPCGAGGGDIGVALGLDPMALTRFRQLAQAAGFLLPALEPEQDGCRLH